MSNLEYNELGQCIGMAVPNWQGAMAPDGRLLESSRCRLEKLDIKKHGAALFAAFSHDKDGANWTYLPYGPFEEEIDFLNWLETTCMDQDPFFYTIIRKEDNLPIGMASYLRIAPAAGSIEVGHIHFSPLLQKTPLATEAMYLMMKHAFEDLGYRRYEWKCNDLNDASKKAALRLGFRFEGVFRQMGVIKGHNRDTTWFSILDSEWDIAKAGFEKWLSPDNFTEDGVQKSSLQTI